MFYLHTFDSKLGKIYIVCSDQYLRYVGFDHPTDYPYLNYDGKPIIEKVVHALSRYFDGQEENFEDIPFEIEGTLFQKRVLSVLKEVTYGKYMTYKDLKMKLESKYQKNVSSQAVGQALSKNKLAIVLGCHRILGQKNKLTGYRFGIDKKFELLKIEGIRVDL